MALAANNSYIVPAGAPFVAGRRTLPSWLSSAATNEWVSVPNGQPSTATGLAPAVAGGMGQQSGMVNAWCGAFKYQNKFYIHGGGHSDYGGNEIGYINLKSENPTWDILIERTPAGSLLGGSNYYADGMPTSRHTYYAMGVAEVSGVPRFLRFNGWMGFAFNGPPTGGAADVRTTDIDGFNLITNTWEPAAYGPVTSIIGSETSFAQDPATSDFFCWNGSNGTIQKYVVAADTCSQAASLGGSDGMGAALVYDNVNARLIRFGGRGSHTCSYWNTITNTKVSPTLIGPDASSISGLTGSNHGWGIAHDTTRNVAYLITNNATLIRVRLDDWYVEVISTSGATPISASNGTWSKIQYYPELDSIAYLANWTSPLLIMRCA